MSGSRRSSRKQGEDDPDYVPPEDNAEEESTESTECTVLVDDSSKYLFYSFHRISQVRVHSYDS